jgi:hypothetical protein
MKSDTPYVCIHGHFYQPPREDPWLDTILPEGSAAPQPNWNLRIARESYAPLAFARRLDGDGRITEIMNCYEWMSFNFGPTLLRWLERAWPELMERIIAGDAAGLARTGHGNAMAQVCHHVIMPLASRTDKETETAWGIDDFRRRFGRAPEGMWLSETAVDTETLEVLAEQGIRFTLLAPRQAAAVAPLDADAGAPTGEHGWTSVDESSLDIYQPYLVQLPSGNRISIFFYHGDLSQAVAFEGLLADGETFYRRVAGEAHPGLLCLGTDGETYGHHFSFGEMGLAYVLEQLREGRDGLAPANFAAYLDAHPPTMQVRLEEPSSWSCVHGVERWRADCGCNTGGGPGWNQKWRKPLRQGLDELRARVHDHYLTAGKDLFTDPLGALKAYGTVYSTGRTSSDFASQHLSPDLDQQERDTAWKLLSMQQWALASQASCAWFFDEISRLEPVNAMTYALRAAQIARETGAADLVPDLSAHLARAGSNIPEMGTGADILETQVLPRTQTPAQLAAQGLLTVMARGGDPAGTHEVSWPGVDLVLRLDGADNGSLDGEMDISWQAEPQWTTYALHSLAPGSTDHTDHTGDTDHTNPWRRRVDVTAPDGSTTTCTPGTDLAWNARQALATAWVTRESEAVWNRRLDAGPAAMRLFLARQEAQQTQTRSADWTELAPALAWLHITTGLESQDPDWLRLFLRQCFSGETDPQGGGFYLHPSQQPLYERLRTHLADAAAEDPGEAARQLERSRQLELEPVLWETQNAVWLRGLSGLPDKVRHALGFA